MYKIAPKTILKPSCGFSLLEIMISLTIMATLFATMAPLVFQFRDNLKETTTKKEMETIHKAVFGDPLAGHYGYVGDMGKLPDAFADLNTKPGSADNYTSSGRVNGVGIGWNGPYLNIGYAANDYLKDDWNRDYIYDNATGQITSTGSDGAQGTNDDIVIPPYSADITGDLSLTVMVYDIGTSMLVPVDSTYVASVVVYSSGGADGGTQVSGSASWDIVDGVFKASNLHQGVHALVVTGDGACSTESSNANALILKGTTSQTIFLGSCTLP